MGGNRSITGSTQSHHDDLLVGHYMGKLAQSFRDGATLPKDEILGAFKEDTPLGNVLRRIDAKEPVSARTLSLLSNEQLAFLACYEYPGQGGSQVTRSGTKTIGLPQIEDQTFIRITAAKVPYEMLTRELVQNSIDAGATEISISIVRDTSKNADILVVEDNGHGMNQGTLQQSLLGLGRSTRKVGAEDNLGIGVKVLLIGKELSARFTTWTPRGKPVMAEFISEPGGQSGLQEISSGQYVVETDKPQLHLADNKVRSGTVVEVTGFPAGAFSGKKMIQFLNNRYWEFNNVKVRVCDGFDFDPQRMVEIQGFKKLLETSCVLKECVRVEGADIFWGIKPENVEGTQSSSRSTPRLNSFYLGWRGENYTEWASNRGGRQLLQSWGIRIGTNRVVLAVKATSTGIHPNWFRTAIEGWDDAYEIARSEFEMNIPDPIHDLMQSCERSSVSVIPLDRSADELTNQLADAVPALPHSDEAHPPTPPEDSTKPSGDNSSQDNSQDDASLDDADQTDQDPPNNSGTGNGTRKVPPTIPDEDDDEKGGGDSNPPAPPPSSKRRGRGPRPTAVLRDDLTEMLEDNPCNWVPRTRQIYVNRNFSTVQELLNGVPEDKHDQVLTQLTAPLIAFIERIEREEANKPTAERRSTSDIELELAVLVRMPSLALLEARKIQKEIEKRKNRATKRSSKDKG